MFGYEYYGVEPDIMTLAKGIGGGVPLAALLAKDNVCCFEAGDQGGTYSMTPIMTAVGLAVVKEMLESDICKNVREMGSYLSSNLMTLMEKYSFITEVRGLGLLIAIGLDGVNANEIQAASLKKRLLVNAPNVNTLRFMPALNINKAEIDECIAVLDSIFQKYL